jgi:hypothetical protein
MAAETAFMAAAARVAPPCLSSQRPPACRRHTSRPPLYPPHHLAEGVLGGLPVEQMLVDPVGDADICVPHQVGEHLLVDAAVRRHRRERMPQVMEANPVGEPRTLAGALEASALHADVEVVGSTRSPARCNSFCVHEVAVSSELSRATARNLRLVTRWRAEACETLHLVDNKKMATRPRQSVAHGGAQRS